jgi:hypothetical protein
MLHPIGAAFFLTAFPFAARTGQDSQALVHALIERTNGLESFVASYRVRGRSQDAERREEEGTLRLVYQAPDQLMVDFEVGEYGLHTVIADGMFCLDNRKDGRSVQRGAAEIVSAFSEAHVRIAGTFHQQLPSLVEIAGTKGAEVFVQVSWKPGNDSERPQFSIQAGPGRGEGALLSWLDQLMRSSVPPSVEDSSLVWNADEGIRVTIGKNSGFLEELVITYKGESRTVLELIQLSVDGPVEDAEFQFPAIDSSVEDISNSLAVSITVGQVTGLRSLIYRRIRDGVASGSLEWTSDLRIRSGEVFRCLHEEAAPLVSSAGTLRAGKSIDEFCLWYQEARRRIPRDDVANSDQVEDKCVEWHAGLRESLDAGIEPHVSHMTTDAVGSSRVDRDLLALEREIAAAAYRRVVVEPLLARFADQLELARRGELSREND